MLDTCPPTTILPITDPAPAVAFYRDALGLPYVGRSGDGKHQFGLAGGGTLALLEKDPGAQAAHTVVSFEVPDVVAAIADLESRGVTFADYDLPGLRTVDHVCVLGSEKAAWFLDPDGNILCLHEILPG